MKDDLINSALFFSGENSKQTPERFYLECFSNLKKEFDFISGAIFYKKSNRYYLEFKFPQDKNLEGACSLKIPFKMQNANIGYFLFKKEESFKKADKIKAKAACEKMAAAIKDYEISKIFSNQLEILQDAILNKNKLTIELEKQNEKLIETDKIRSEFLANVSHELRTPLNSIIGFSTALKDEMIGSMNDKQKNYAEKILSSAIHLTGLINDILDMAKIESKAMKLNLAPQNPNIIIDEVVNIIEPLANEKNIKIVTDYNFDGLIMLDNSKFKQIIYNLSGNAIKFSHENSKIIIKTKKIEEFAIIEVKDYGVGIDKKDCNKIFEKFVQLDNIYTKKYSSTGLGLTITKELMKLHNAEIGLSSAPNKGTTFKLKFKIAKA